jgi:hypothetical protein
VQGETAISGFNICYVLLQLPGQGGPKQQKVDTMELGGTVYKHCFMALPLLIGPGRSSMVAVMA